MDRIDCVVVGAGVIGLAIARELALAGQEVVVLESESRHGTGTSSRNSGVIHAGLYYPAGSLKAQWCVQGKHLLYDYAVSRQVVHANIGKLIVVGLEIGEIVPHLAPEQWFHFQNLCLSLPKLHTVHLDGIRHARRVMLSEIASFDALLQNYYKQSMPEAKTIVGDIEARFKAQCIKTCASHCGLRSWQLHRRRVMKRLRNRLVGGSG
jgi:hypothetical protein